MSLLDNPDYAAAGKGLLAKTGQDLLHWVDVARNAGITGHMALVQHLKDTHGLGHGHANTVVHAANASAAASQDSDALITAMFEGPRAAWRPTYDALVAAIMAFGGDVELAPKKGYVSLRRKKQFALLQPSTKDRFDVGLALKGEAPVGALELAGSWNAMVSHRVRIAFGVPADAALAGWLRAAYDRAG
ncbi:MAG: DUF4287 domain-containing protein [Sphingopyxis sp.]|nr:DUF4287 domain-containing protein [Sphingopyxis sp.]